MGLFVTAHDAMHGAVCGRRWRQLNDWLGASCITCYAFFSYTKLHEEHWRHHHWTGRTKMAAELAAQRQRRGNEVGGGKKGAAATAAEKNLKQQQDHADPPLLRYDPDYHTGNPRLLPWFASFMAHYSSPGQYARIAAATAFLLWLGAPYLNLCLFMCGAAVLAAFQLFYWGTYRPHRPDAAALKAHARAGDAAAAEMPWRRSRSAPWPNPVLFLQAYFFNLHYHHHRWPYCPWWDLPRLRREAGLAGVVPVLGREEGEEAY
jgi:beta-carotene ketolase (CrtW type)